MSASTVMDVLAGRLENCDGVTVVDQISNVEGEFVQLDIDGESYELSLTRRWG